MMYGWKNKRLPIGGLLVALALFQLPAVVFPIQLAGVVVMAGVPIACSDRV